MTSELRDPFAEPYSATEWDAILGNNTGERIVEVLAPLQEGFPRLRPSRNNLVDTLNSALTALAGDSSIEQSLPTDLWIANPDQVEVTAVIGAMVTNTPQSLQLAERLGDASLDQIIDPMIQGEINAAPNGLAVASRIRSRIEMVNWPSMAREVGYGGYEHPAHSVIVRTVKKLVTYQATLEALGKPDKAALIAQFTQLALQGNFPVGILNGRFLTLTGDQYKPTQGLPGFQTPLLQGRR